ncbi:hypothetical protein SAMN05421841_3641 [Chryseobacterium wanjuense]|uniref:Uncharacterized protein n=1 Tax=Chryseobacterium wanjuense TaxID=356305 RepID=A0A1I0S0S2_9FLAO|nr:hypothetical protein [Chryseobacterium wanjuense]SEW47837.1 hypothetical protein SAMN05421841_3641 [Chryseobacterium wanjuense]
MPDTIFLYFLIASILLQTILGVFFFNQKKKIISEFKQTDSIELENINGVIITENGYFRKNFKWCKFDLMINQNSIFLFPKNFYFIPNRAINLLFSYSDKKNTKRPELLREFNIGKHSIELVYYRRFFLAEYKKIYLKNLNPEQLSILENSLNGKSRRFY